MEVLSGRPFLSIEIADSEKGRRKYRKEEAIADSALVSIICLFAFSVPTRGTVLSRMTNERDSRMIPLVGKASIVADWKIRT